MSAPHVKVQPMGLQSVTAAALPEYLFQLLHILRRKLSTGNKLPGVTESRAWQSLAQLPIPFVTVQIGVELGKVRRTVSFPERQSARLAEVWVRMAF